MKKLLALAALMPLAGCISFGAKPPPLLLTLESSATVPVGEVRGAAGSPTIAVAVPAVPQELAVTRVPVRASETGIAYVTDAQWVEPPAALFARLLSDTLTAKTNFVVISSRQAIDTPGAFLSGELRSFGVDATTGEAVVTYDAQLIRGGTSTVEKRRFEARVPAAPIEAGPVSVALNGAANQVAGEVTTWVSGS